MAGHVSPNPNEPERNANSIVGSGKPRCLPLSCSRRELITLALGSAAATLSGCDRWNAAFSKPLPQFGDWLAPNFAVGHQLRDKTPTTASGNATSFRDANGDQAPLPDEHVPVAIVGGGVAGLSAAWRLQNAGVQDFIVLELESVPGGTSRSGSRDGASFPWGAHYLPVPMPDNRPLIECLHFLGIVESFSDDGVIVGEQHLCREPEERLWAGGRWQPGLWPSAIATQDDERQLREFQTAMMAFAGKRDDQGRRWFAIPIESSSPSESARSLDQMSMADWMVSQSLDSLPLRWLVDHSCRDDYGLSIDDTSAWAGIFYFAARTDPVTGDSQSVMTWPGGNGFLVDGLSRDLGPRLRCGQAVLDARHDAADAVSPVVLTVTDTRTRQTRTIAADRVIWAIPQYIARRLVPRRSEIQEPVNGPSPLDYGSWWVANVHLRDRPAETSGMMCWDNVIHASPSLGYVNAAHQTGRDHGPAVLTWYMAIPDRPAQSARQKLLGWNWADAAEVVCTDLEMAHPDIRPLIDRIDILRWGHAMIRPHVGSLFHPDRVLRAKPDGPHHFAGTDLSGIALFEEAFDHGIRAADEVIKARQGSASSTPRVSLPTD